jgi:(2Fe-2S) ferredoxin
MARYKRHILICENIRDEDHPRGSCGRKCSEDIRMAFKTALKNRGMTTVYRANKSGCLDACEFGPVVVVYPDGVWYGGVTATDVEEIIEEHVIGGKPVTRLMISDQRFQQEFD